MKAINVDKQNTQLAKNLIIILIISICLIINIKPVQAITMQPNDSQYLEMRAVEIKETESGEKQLLFELWANDIDFKGVDARFSYDSTKYVPSNITTNAETDDETEYFAFESEYVSKLDMFTVTYSGDTSGIRMIISFNTPVEDSENIQNETLISSGKSILLGKMSFKMMADEFDISGFNLIPDSTTSPTTGIKINIDVGNCYEAQSTFIFTDRTASKDATLKNIKLSTGTEDTENPENSTYKEYELTPTFEKDTKEYTLELNEYIDEMNLEAEQNDEKSSMKVKVPKRDENGKLVYDTNGSTIIYEEKDLSNKTKIPITLNKLGEPDTIIEIIVTAEDGKTQEKYKVTIHRPYGTIKGQSILADFDNPDVVENYLDIYGVQINNRTDINIYKSDLAEWESITDIYGMVYENPLTYEELENIEKEATIKSNDDGTFEIYVIPGQYDVQITRLAYLDYIYSDVIVNEGDIIDMGQFGMAAGDANRDGVISQEDINEIKKNIDMDSSDPDYSEAFNPTQVGTVLQEDLGYTKQNQDEELKIVYFN